MKNLYRVISLLLLLAMLASCVGTAFAAEAPEAEQNTRAASTCTKRHTRVETWQLEDNKHYSVCYDCHTAITEECTFQVLNRINPTATKEGSIVYICAGSAGMSDEVSHDYFTGKGCGRTYKVTLPAGTGYTYTNNHNGTHTRTCSSTVETNLTHVYTNGVCACGEKANDFLSLQFNQSSVANEVGSWMLNSSFLTVDAESGVLLGTAYGTDPYFGLDASGHMLGYSIKSGDIIEVRMKSNILSGTSTDIQVFYTTTAYPGYSEGRSVKLTNVGFTAGEYQIFRFPMTKNIGEVMNAIRLDPFSNITGSFKAEFEVDYIYVGAPAHAPSNYDNSNLRFDFTGGAEAVAKYSANDAYNAYNFDDATALLWNTSTTGFQTGTAAIDNAAGTLTLSPKAESAEFIYLDTLAPLSYEMSHAEVLQVRLKMENFSAAEGKKPFMTMEFRSNGSNIGNAPDTVFTATQMASDDSITYTVALTDALRACGTVDALRLYFGNVSGNAASKLTIDYIYVGTMKDLPEKASIVTFCNEDGTVLSTQTVNLGQAVSYIGATPAKGYDAEHHYSFAGWVDANGKPADLSNVTGTMTVYASFTAEPHSYSESITTQPSCTAQGVKTYTCSGCARSYTENVAETGHTLQTVGVIPATCTAEGYTGDKVCTVCGTTVETGTVIAKGAHTPVYEYEDADGHLTCCANCVYSQYTAHTYINGVCVCGASEAPAVDESIKMNHSLDLANDIAIHFVVQKSQLAAYSSYYLECAIPTYEGNALVGTSTVTVQPVLNGSYYYFTLDGLTSIRMNDMVEARLHMTKDGKEYVSNVDRYSIATYAYNQLNKADASDALKEMCANLLQYGAKAQIFKGYRTDALVDAAMTEAHKAYLTNLDSVSFNNHNKVLADVTNPAITWAGKTLSLESRVVVRYVVDASAYTGEYKDLSLRVSYIDSEGDSVTAEITAIEEYNAEKKWYVFDFAQLRAAELRSVLSAAVYEGEAQVSPTLQYSVDTYCSNKTGTLGDLCKAMIAYADSAESFFAK